MPDLEPSPAAILDERLSDLALKPASSAKQLDALHELARFASTVVLTSAFHGNVTCKNAVPEILKLLKQLKSK